MRMVILLNNSLQNPLKDFNLNVNSTIQSIFDFKYTKYIFISTIEVYNNKSKPQFNHENIKINPNILSNYGFDKYLAEQCITKYCHDFIIIRLGGIIGENMIKNPVYDIFVRKKIFVDINSKYQYIMTTDVGKILWGLIKNENNGIFNLCGNGNISLKEIITMFNQQIERDIYMKPLEVYNVNINKIKKIISIPETVDVLNKFYHQYHGD